MLLIICLGNLPKAELPELRHLYHLLEAVHEPVPVK